MQVSIEWSKVADGQMTAGICLSHRSSVSEEMANRRETNWRSGRVGTRKPGQDSVSKIEVDNRCLDGDANGKAG
jgi:hypothetical protein